MSSAGQIRVRFAPSPTGHLHVGNARTALFNWLFARGGSSPDQSGVFILRIEDTDIERSEARYEDELIADLKWMGLDWDEGPDAGGPYAPYRQSDRSEIYAGHARRLLDAGKAYWCFCTAAELAAERERSISRHQPQVYSGRCRNLDPREAEQRHQAGVPAAIRLKIPEHPISFHDIVRGTVEFSSEVVSDLIIMRSNGAPVYNFVVVVDDALMKITHVIRGDDHLSNTPKQVALYEALGWQVPEFAHLSTLLGPDRERLSKRHGATSIANFREMGILPEALVNYLALLGWAPAGGNRETFSLQELQQEFSLERVTPSPAIFDMEKLHWLNRHYLRLVRAERLLDLAYPFFVKAGWLPEPAPTIIPDIAGWFERVLEMLLPAVDRLDQLTGRAALIFDYDAARALAAPDNREVLSGEKAAAVTNALAQRVREENHTPLSVERFKQIINAVKADTGAKGKELFHPIRIVITGSHSGPEFDKIIPIVEAGSQLELAKHMLSVRERVAAFQAAGTASG